MKNKNIVCVSNILRLFSIVKMTTKTLNLYQNCLFKLENRNGQMRDRLELGHFLFQRIWISNRLQLNGFQISISIKLHSIQKGYLVNVLCEVDFVFRLLKLRTARILGLCRRNNALFYHKTLKMIEPPKMTLYCDF